MGGEHHTTDAIFPGESTSTHFRGGCICPMAILDWNMEEKVSLIPLVFEPPTRL